MPSYNPYQQALGRQNETLDLLGRISKQGQTSSVRVSKINDLKNELFNIQKDKYKKIDEDIKASERKAKRGGLGRAFRKLLRGAGLFMGPGGAALTSGIASYDEAKSQKKSYEWLAKALQKHGEFSGGWRGKMQGLNWLSQPTEQFTENVMSGKRDVERQAASINPLQNALMSGLTSGISAKLSGQEGIFGGGKLKKAISNIGEGGFKDLLSQQFLPGFTGTTLEGGTQTLLQYLKTAEGGKEGLKLLPKITGALEDENIYNLPTFNRYIYGR